MSRCDVNNRPQHGYRLLQRSFQGYIQGTRHLPVGFLAEHALQLGDQHDGSLLFLFLAQMRSARNMAEQADL